MALREERGRKEGRGKEKRRGAEIEVGGGGGKLGF